MDHQISDVLVPFGIVLFCIAAPIGGYALVLLVEHFDEYLRSRRKARRRRQKAAILVYNRVEAAPDLPTPASGHTECGGKFCELRGCAIIGSCQAPRSVETQRLVGHDKLLRLT